MQIHLKCYKIHYRSINFYGSPCSSICLGEKVNSYAHMGAELSGGSINRVSLWAPEQEKTGQQSSFVPTAASYKVAQWKWEPTTPSLTDAQHRREDTATIIIPLGDKGQRQRCEISAMLSKGGSSSRPSLPLLRISMTNDVLYPAVIAHKPTMHCFAVESDPAVAVFSSHVSVCCHFPTWWIKEKMHF